MTVSTTLRQWSATAANNNPKGTDVIGTSADDELRAIQAVVRQYLASQSSTVAPSAGVADLTTATGHWVPVSGSSTLTGLGSEDAGIEYILNFTGAPTLVHSTALQLPGQATISASTSDVCVAESLGSGNWRIWGLSHLDSAPARQAVLGVPQASTSGSTIGQTGIGAWVTEVTVTGYGVSTNGTSQLIIQIGDSGGYETSSYVSDAASAGAASTAVDSETTGFLLHGDASSAATTANFVAILKLVNASTNTWMITGTFTHPGTNVAMFSGYKSLSSTLDRVQLTTVAGNAFDAGEVNFSYR